MNAHFLLLGMVLVSQVSAVLGEFLYKHAMTGERPGWHSRLPLLAAGFGAQTLSFFLWLGLLDRADLSYLFPFQSLNVVVITVGAVLVLREK